MAVQRRQGVDKEGQKTQVGLGVGARLQQVYPGVRAQGPVVVLARPVHACEGLLVKQDAKVVATGNLFQQLHQHQVVVIGQVGLLKDGRQLKLVGGHLVVTGGHRNAQLVRLHLKVLHERRHALWDGPKVVVVQLLTLCRGRAEEGATCHRQIGTGGVQRLVHQEVLLLPAQGGVHLGDVLVEVLAHRRGCSVHSRQRFQQRRFVVERIACVADENGRDAQGLPPHKGRRSGVPQGVSTCLKSVANAAARER